MIPVTRPRLPARQTLDRYIDGIYQRNWLTNNGPLVRELTRRLEAWLGVENLLLVANGTLALQLAYRVLGVSGQDPDAEAITTPFTFIATASSLKWEGVRPVFADIHPQTWCLDPQRIEAAITPRTRAIVPVHVYGNACDVEAIDALARRYDLKVVYDAAHTFGVEYKGRSLLNWGDAATLSFHATKVFHTIEGGAIVFRHREDLERARLMTNFGITGPGEIGELGINAKMNEFQAAMGLSLLDEMDGNLQARAAIWHTYEAALGDRVRLQRRDHRSTNNYGYFPLLLDSQAQVQELMARLQSQGVQARRYFYPCLENLGLYGGGRDAGCPVAQDVSNGILCLPVYDGLAPNDCDAIIDHCREAVAS